MRPSTWRLEYTLILCLVLRAEATRYSSDTIRQNGRCSMYDTCGSKGGIFGQKIPCADNEKARGIQDNDFRTTLTAVCGEQTQSWQHTCCTIDQLNTLQSSLSQAEPLLALCPACRFNFRDFYCMLTCSPDQSTFVTVTDVQNLTQNDAVKSLAYHVEPSFGSAFFDSCKNVKFGATNGYAMDLVGGGAKNWLAFLHYMGTERPGLGSPFQIDFPQPPSHFPNDKGNVSSITPYNATALSCASDDPNIRCACADCPAVCLELPETRSPAQERAGICRVGRLSCFSFVLLILYALGLVAFVFGFGLKSLWDRRGAIHLPATKTLRNKTSNLSGTDRMPMEDPREDGHATSWRSSESADTGSVLRPEWRPPSDSSGLDTVSPSASYSRHRLGRGAALLRPDDAVAAYQPRTYALNTILSRAFYRLGYFCASKPFVVIALGLAVCGILNAGWSKFAVERDPVKLWVAKGSATEINKEKFDGYFGPFYRTEQIYVSVASEEALFEDTPVLNWDRLQFWANVEEDIRNLKSSKNGYTLTDVCFAPRSDGDTQPDDCIVQSFMGYFGNSLASVDADSWQSQLVDCATSPSLCLPPSGAPLNPRLLFGGIPHYSGRTGTDASTKDDARVAADLARALVITYVVANSLDQQVIARAEEWENALREYLSDLQTRAKLEKNLKISYSTGVSLEQEINKSTNTDIPIVVFSYLLMFMYVSLSLGGTTPAFGRLLAGVARKAFAFGKRKTGPISLPVDNEPSLKYLFHRILIESKFLLGFWGIIIVLLSVSTSVGLFSFFGVKITLIIAEVIPFLVLAIGVDNVFLLAHEVDRQNSNAYLAMARHGIAPALSDTENRRTDYDEDLDGLPLPEERVAKALSRMGPSILLSATCESVAFALGALVGMPAVRNFAIYAAGAVVINAVLQVTVFVSAITLDLRRTEASRIDCIPCIKLPTISITARPVSPTLISRFISNTYAPVLLNKHVKKGVLVIFSALFVLSWAGSREVQLGLDQRLALPTDSYLVDYFDALDAFLDVGPPVYFVAEDVRVEDRLGQESVCSRFSTCDAFSLSNTLEAERKRADASFLAEPPAVWIDDFFQWLNPVLDSCCRVKTKNHTEFCRPEDSEFACIPCYEAEPDGWHVNLDGLPENTHFMRYLEQWLKSPTDEVCPLGGRASYSTAVSLNREGTHIQASHFRTFHTPLKSQADFIDSLASADRIAAGLSQKLGSNVFPYSLHYVFFDQYAYLTATTRKVLLFAWLAVFGVSSIALGSWRTGAVLTLTVAMTTLNVMGSMGVWHISLNAISLVNLVISVGIAVEFCSHIARSFMTAMGGGLPHSHPAGPNERDERAWSALADVGSSVFTGITMTKLIGVAVLALTRSKLLRTYYFKMWLILIISGALHGLVFLPVALSYEGGQGYAVDNEDESFLSDHLISTYSNRPFLVQDDDESIAST